MRQVIYVDFKNKKVIKVIKIVEPINITIVEPMPDNFWDHMEEWNLLRPFLVNTSEQK